LLVSWSLASLFSTNMAISETKFTIVIRGGWWSSPPTCTASCTLPVIRITIFGNYEAPVTLTLDWVKVTSAYTIRVGLSHAQPSDFSLTHYRNITIWILWNIDILRSLNSCDSFPRRKFQNQAQTSCRLGAIVSGWSLQNFSRLSVQAGLNQVSKFNAVRLQMDIICININWQKNWNRIYYCN